MMVLGCSLQLKVRNPAKGKPLGTCNRSIRESQRVEGLRCLQLSLKALRVLGSGFRV